MTTLTNSFEAGPIGAPITTGISGGRTSTRFDGVTVQSTGSITYCTPRMHGNLACLFTNAAGNACWVEWNASLTGQAGAGLSGQVNARAYVWYASIPTTEFSPLRGMSPGGGAQRWRLAISNSGQLLIRNNSNAIIATSTTVLTAGTFWRIEAAFTSPNTTAGVAEVRIYVGDTTTPVETLGPLSGQNFGGPLGSVRAGHAAACSLSNPIVVDDFAVSTDGWIGPYVDPVPSAKLASLVDTFSDPAINQGIWTPYIPAGSGVILANGTLQTQITAGATTPRPAGLTSVATYDLTSSSVYVQLPNQGTPATGWEVWPLSLVKDFDATAGTIYNGLYVVLSGGFIGLYQNLGGVQTGLWFGAYDPVAIQWIRVSESGGTITFEHSADGNQWAAWSTTPAPTFPLTDLFVQLGANVWSSQAFPQTANFDNLNYNPNYVSRDWRVALVGSGAGSSGFAAPTWDFLLYGPGSFGNPTDPSTWTQLSDLPAAKTRHWEVSLSDTSSITFEMDGHHADAALIQELGMDVRVERSGTPIMRARITGSGDTFDESGHSTSFSGYDYREMLKSKILYGDVTVGSPADAEFVYWHQIDLAQTRVNGTLGITRLGTPAGITVAATTSTNPLAAAGGSVYDIVNQATTVYALDWDIDADLVYQVFPTGRGAAKNWLLDLGGTVKSGSRAVDLGNFANAIRVTGSQSGISATAETADVDNGVSAIGRWERQEGNLDYATATQASGAAATWVSTDAQVIPGYDLVLYQGVWGGPTDLWVGDRVPVEVISGRLNVQTTLRVLKMAGDIDSNGAETITVTVGSLSPNDVAYKAAAKTYRDLRQLLRR